MLSDNPGNRTKLKASVVLQGKTKRICTTFKNYSMLYLFLIPALAYFLIYHYIPMYGVIIAFKDYSPFMGVIESPWVGWKYFESFFNSIYFWRLIRNTFLLSFYSLIYGFPIPIIFALLLNELPFLKYRSLVQTISYIPHFVSTVVIVGMISKFLSPTSGFVNSFIELFGGEAINFMSEPSWFRTVYISSGIWQGVGWSSIIYFAALSAISPTQYEAAKIDGANRWQRIWYISLPGMLPTILTMLLLSLGNIMSVGFEKVYLMYKPVTYETADIISTYVYRSGILEQNYSFASAVGLFNSVINLVLITTFNYLSRRISDYSLW